MKHVKMKTTVIVPTNGDGPDQVYQQGRAYQVSDEFAEAYKRRVEVIEPAEPETKKPAAK